MHPCVRVCARVRDSSAATLHGRATPKRQPRRAAAPTPPAALPLRPSQCGMARLPNNAALLVMFTNFLIESRQDAQGARTQLQLAAKASPSLLDNFNLFVAQQLAKALKRGAA